MIAEGTRDRGVTSEDRCDIQSDNYFFVPFSFRALNVVAECKFAHCVSGVVLNLSLRRVC